ncbi:MULTISPECIES: hypothetical protein [Streptomyces]|uniref:Uncharacterized protein n=1 Tax=Streptomyces griseus subsp. griseus (strain JCM 4626 / CBS 651.72 / NBRC 13350 / KCC S-0626 / ISP 5235) TaxID=455632 RepID=B1W4T7_STRGG|nr:hypothetical protein [Streptomyces griseus]MBW3705370.1 hypothetical protein [Streptomyces griseus]BAG19731.1 hypothetical protein SGR_2902 [Streptomyces griseus subsp. griseus NBRC 13350]SEE87505.1 hypothetical protein SAMN04490359_6624 [Streptomyces griseus]SQA23583.1 Uncharacterised protein [Streptomyces griseus]
MRLRLQLTGWDRRTLILTDTPRPDCPLCAGHGGLAYDYGDHEGEYAGTEWDPCTCWDETRRRTLLRLPRLRRRHQVARDPWSDEPPF